MMRKLLVLISLIALIFGAWYLASPWFAMNGLAEAAQDGDTAALEDKVDFPALRASTSEQITEAARRGSGQSGLLARVPAVVTERIGREALDRALTPETVGRMVASGTLAADFLPEQLRGQEISWGVEREGFDSFRAIGTFEDGTAGPTLIFARDGLAWKLTGFELPGPAL